MVCTGGINRPCQGDGGAPLVCFNLILNFRKILKLTFDIRFVRRIRVSGSCMVFQSTARAVANETIMARQFSSGPERLYSLSVT